MHSYSSKHGDNWEDASKIVAPSKTKQSYKQFFDSEEEEASNDKSKKSQRG